MASFFLFSQFAFHLRQGHVYVGGGDRGKREAEMFILLLQCFMPSRVPLPAHVCERTHTCIPTHRTWSAGLASSAQTWAGSLLDFSSGRKSIRGKWNAPCPRNMAEAQVLYLRWTPGTSGSQLASPRF
uniref:Uncharacterized protein n=1 Tax=Piliocolobus tephrosceles TaxID=591936 RepID=A0A8C9IB85_9PRIM